MLSKKKKLLIFSSELIDFHDCLASGVVNGIVTGVLDTVLKSDACCEMGMSHSMSIH